jgi:hypothetical protein
MLSKKVPNPASDFSLKDEEECKNIIKPLPYGRGFLCSIG